MHKEYLTDEFDMMTGVDGHIQVSSFKNYPKSMIGNNGMFDMTNPNIYKGLIPAAGLIDMYNLSGGGPQSDYIFDRNVVHP